ncbi:MAG TPA: polysaccharide ABC transporter ATP-binding protein [Thermoanaerobaculia bacterium]|jgi:lipopolysaccharide transport system ATP-binding protein|nr:polysaccharide ABC transporter ATP-binding protein [Thermoanaerobaculia bacterium]
MKDAITAQGIGKTYRLGEQATAYGLMRERVADLFKAPFRKREASAPKEPFWALKDVSFTIGQAEVVGLIGKNGAGKSTLLKILSRITEPTEGRVDLYGRVSSLLEVGIGFHPELSGRDNVYLNGAILGMSRNEIRRKFDEIVEFAEIAKFLDTPVKRYSSGMYVRLAFAVAAHLEPDILIVDEVLAVGDAAFQQKCLGKMRDIRSEGRTVIVVSHNMATIATLCQRVLWLDAGRLTMAGATQETVQRYLSEGAQYDMSWVPRHPSNAEFEYHSVSVLRADTKEMTDSIPGDVGIDIMFDFSVVKPLSDGRIELRLVNDFGEVLFTTTSADPDLRRNHPWSMGRHTFTCLIPANLLPPGTYRISVTHPFGGWDIVHENILAFAVTEQNSLAAIDGRAGKIAPRLDWSRD